MKIASKMEEKRNLGEFKKVVQILYLTKWKGIRGLTPLVSDKMRLMVWFIRPLVPLGQGGCLRELCRVHQLLLLLLLLLFGWDSVISLSNNTASMKHVNKVCTSQNVLKGTYRFEKFEAWWPGIPSFM